LPIFLIALLTSKYRLQNVFPALSLSNFNIAYLLFSAKISPRVEISKDRESEAAAFNFSPGKKS
jgi:hypothetical protein